VQPDFWGLEREVMCAVRDVDAATLDRILSEDFVITTAGWLRQPANKQTWLDALSQHALADFQLHEVAVRAYGVVAVALVHSTQSGHFRDAPYTHEFRYTDVWRLQGGSAWQLEVRHATLLP
jgi:ketosteroid isomerase-like protein